MFSLFHFLGFHVSDMCLCAATVNRFKLESSEWAIIRAIYELPTEKRHFKNIITKRNFFVTHQLMATKG